MENINEVTTAFDPRADLDLLDRSKNSVAVNDILDGGPAWYAPLMATCIGGLTLFGQDFSAPLNIVYAVLGFGSGIAMAVHDFRRRAVRPKVTLQSAGLVLIVVLLAWVLVGAWGTAVSTIGYDDFVPVPALVAWLVTTGVLLALRSLGHSILDRRSVMSS